MKAIDPLNLEPPYDPIYDDLEVWKVTIFWDGGEWETRYIPYIGYDSHEMLSDFKEEFFHDVLQDVGKVSPPGEEEFVCSLLTRDELIYHYESNGYTDTKSLLSSVRSYSDRESYETKYYKKEIIDWLKDNQERWVKIDVMNFWSIPEDEQKEIRSFIEEERAIEDYINRGGEL